MLPLLVCMYVHTYMLFPALLPVLVDVLCSVCTVLYVRDFKLRKQQSSRCNCNSCTCLYIHICVYVVVIQVYIIGPPNFRYNRVTFFLRITVRAYQAILMGICKLLRDGIGTTVLTTLRLYVQ